MMANWVCWVGQVLKEKAQQAVQSTHDAVRPYLDAAADKTGGDLQINALLHINCWWLLPVGTC